MSHLKKKNKKKKQAYVESDLVGWANTKSKLNPGLPFLQNKQPIQIVLYNFVLAILLNFFLFYLFLSYLFYFINFILFI